MEFTNLPELTAKKAAQLAEVKELSRRLGVDILAHFFQRAEVKMAADFVGGAGEIIEQARKLSAKPLMICGPSYLTEELTRLLPEAELLIPRDDLSCPLAEAVTPEMLDEAKTKHPEAVVLADVKVAPALRALADAEISPQTAKEVVGKYGDKPFIVLPGAQVLDWAALGERVVHRWPEAVCQVHEQATLEDVRRAKEEHPGAKVAAHLLCHPDIWPEVDFLGDSAQIRSFVAESQAAEFIIVCEAGLAEYLNFTLPQKRFYETDTEIFCPNMKLTTLKTMVTKLTQYTERSL